jgi:hypothetical protein
VNPAPVVKAEIVAPKRAARGAERRSAAAVAKNVGATKCFASSRRLVAVAAAASIA